MNIYLKFEYLHPEKNVWQAFPAGVNVEAIDFDPLVPDNVLGSSLTDANGQIHIVLPTETITYADTFSAPDIYFKIYPGKMIMSGCSFPSEWSSKKNKDTAGRIGYYSNFNDDSIGSPENPVTFQLSGLTAWLEFYYYDEIQKKSISVPAGLIVEMWDYDPISQNELLATSITNEKGEVTLTYYEGSVDQEPFEGNPDIYFIIHTGEIFDKSANQPATQSTKMLRDVDGRKGYFPGAARDEIGRYDKRLRYVLCPRLDSWLSDHSAIANAISWWGWPYPLWSKKRKASLQEAFEAVWKHESLSLTDPPPNIMSLDDDETVNTRLDKMGAWELFEAHVAHCLAVEIGRWVPWSLTSYSSENLMLLLDSGKMFTWRLLPNGYEMDYRSGKVVPAPPNVTYNFLLQNDLIKDNQLKTIGSVLEWCRQNLSHFTGGWETRNMEEHWHYRGYPPVSRIIAGTINFFNNLYRSALHYTAGCWGTTGFLRAVLWVINVPAYLVSIDVEQDGIEGEHAQQYFPTEGKYLCHGDDPYNRDFKARPDIPAEALLIDQTTYDSWFGSSVTKDVKFNNLGRRLRELVGQ